MNEELKLLVIPVLIGILEVFKKLGLPVKYVPVLSLLLGVLASVSVSGLAVENFMQGLVYGLSACGLYSGTKATLEEVE
ncbi:hypothetical protein [Microaceticoccus formicicus]|uniref:hypothetical protein n=1 Tax=Microaceticoccus formicicus TaxID=3118105 RepID=UPI003CD00428|nr:hypothetical protein VZL98_01740 [Peptoniphilaceae bacterium AMB_02]